MAVGDSDVGKRSLILSYANEKFPSEYMPSAFVEHEGTLNMGDDQRTFKLSTISGMEQYDRLRPLKYPEVTVLLVCFSVISPISFDNVRDLWVPEIGHHCPDVPFFIVGTQVDQRGDTRVLEKLQRLRERPIPTDKGEKLASEVGALRYLECSALTQMGLNNVVEKALLAALGRPIDSIGL
ncbi:small GTPase CDC42 [Sistotremastrum niveocremeum HHB9708]|uniref:Small GTPase CDC42 n=1 Tax=Sistotremastrum niveocremeum HHB9708 TaxID=1314777 RepID=A0A164T173_9AGAM|nr:small GTPase CDC42 [Sistotremastrum niveocremeum HHB9708]